METTQSYYYHAGFKKAVTIFGSRFNNMQIERVDANNTTTQTIDVPIQYAPIQKYLARLKADESGKRRISMILPVMSFELINMARRSDVTHASIEKVNRTDGKNYRTPVYYDLDFQLNVLANNMEDSLKIVEQILPMFNPKLAIKARLLDNIDDAFNISLTLNNTALNDTYENDFSSRRAVLWQLDFTMNFPFFGPVADSTLIKFVKTNIYSDQEMTQLDQTMIAKPGLTANGEPTTTSNNSIDYTLINPDDNYGFIFTIDDDPD